MRSEDTGFLVTVEGGELIAWARRHDALVRQCAQVGEFVLPGQVLAEVWAPGDAWTGKDAGHLRSQFTLGSQRTLPQDPSFPVRQLADVALKGLSPGINDPTTAVNAMDAMAAGLVEFARADQPSEVRVDEDGAPRFLAARRDLDELVRLGFTQVARCAASDPTVLARLRHLVGSIAAAAGDQERWSEEPDELARLLAES